MIRVLFLCTGNSCRSQMAEGLLRHFGNNKFEVFSAGTHHSFVHPLAIEVMKEIGIDISNHKSKHVSEFLGQKFDYVITVCDRAKESFLPLHQQLHTLSLIAYLKLYFSLSHLLGNEARSLEVLQLSCEVQLRSFQFLGL